MIRIHWCACWPIWQLFCFFEKVCYILCWEINFFCLECATSIPRKYFNLPNSLIWNSLVKTLRSISLFHHFPSWWCCLHIPEELPRITEFWPRSFLQLGQMSLNNRHHMWCRTTLGWLPTLKGRWTRVLFFRV